MATGLVLEVAARALLSPGIVRIDLARADGGDLPAFTAGAHIDVAVADGIVRQYSLCNDPAERHRYSIAVLREVQSRGGSATVHDAFMTGRQVSVGEPRNLFPLVPDAGRHILIGGGIGITPMIAMAATLTAGSTPFDLHYCVRDHELAGFAADVATLGGWLHCSRDGGRFDAAAAVGEWAPGTHLYLCGPAGFMDAVADAVRDQNWPGEALHRELFVASETLVQADDQPFEVRIASSGAVFAVPPGISVAVVLASNGVEVPVSCEQGICGTCITGILDGVPDHRDSFLTDDEHERGGCFTPCCSRARTPFLVLDL